MNTERLFNVVLLELTTDKMQIEDNLEQAFASTDNIQVKSMRIKDLVARLAAVESTINKFNAMVSINNNENNKETKTN